MNVMVKDRAMVMVMATRHDGDDDDRMAGEDADANDPWAHDTHHVKGVRPYSRESDLYMYTQLGATDRGHRANTQSDAEDQHR